MFLIDLGLSTDYKSVALPIELHQQYTAYYIALIALLCQIITFNLLILTYLEFSKKLNALNL